MNLAELTTENHNKSGVAMLIYALTFCLGFVLTFEVLVCLALEAIRYLCGLDPEPGAGRLRQIT